MDEQQESLAFVAALVEQARLDARADVMPDRYAERVLRLRAAQIRAHWNIP